MRRLFINLCLSAAVVGVFLWASPMIARGQKRPGSVIIEVGKKPTPKAKPKATPKATPKVSKPKPKPVVARKSPPRTPPPPRAALLELEWEVLKVDDRGIDTPIIPTAIFHTGDFLRLRLRASREGYLYVVHQAGPTEPARLIFPDSRLQNESNLKADEQKIFPSNCPPGVKSGKSDIISAPRCAFEVKVSSPQEIFTLIFVRDALADLPQAIVRSGGGMPAEQLTGLIGQTGQQLARRPGNGKFSFIVSNKNSSDQIVVQLVLNKAE